MAKQKEIIDRIISDLKDQVDLNVLEETNFNLLKKLIENAENTTEAIQIAQMGTIYMPTGYFHYQPKLDCINDGKIKYLIKDEKLSFENKGIHHKLIIGENYSALLNLLVEYKGKIDVIYIDPPYGADSMGKFAETSYKNDISRDNLLSEMEPRLILARELLSPDGIIFCSIDEKNNAYFKLLFNKVFGEKNAKKTLVWESAKPFGMTKLKGNDYPKTHEYIIRYVKDPDIYKFEPTYLQNSDAYYTKEGKRMVEHFINKDSAGKLIPDGSIIKAKENKIYSTDFIQGSMQSVGFGAGQKPIELIEKLILSHPNKNATVLDFFAGSGTTGHAVLRLNNKDHGKRQFILCTLNENVGKNMAHKNENKSIPIDICWERLHYVMTGKRTNDAQFTLKIKTALGDSLDVYHIGEIDETSKDVFDTIDPSCYGKKFSNKKDKIDWVCQNFEQTTKQLKDK